VGVKKMKRDEALCWDIMKFCKGYKADQIKIDAKKKDSNYLTLLDYWEGNNKFEKIKTVSNVVDVRYFDTIKIVLPNKKVYEPY
jgi:hypothetical protein